MIKIIRKNISNSIKCLLIFIVIFTFFSCSSDSDNDQNSNLKIWFDKPAEKWTEALPIGNGRLGAMIFGGISEERIQLNEESLWAGIKINNNNPGALKHLSKIQNLILDGKIEDATKLAERFLLGTPPRIRSYQSLGDLFIYQTNDGDSFSDYRRELDLSTGISTVKFNSGQSSYTREVFASADNDVIVIRIESTNKSSINLRINMSREKDALFSTISNNSIQMTGQIFDEDDPLRGPGGEHMKFSSILKVITDGGKTYTVDKSIVVKDANNVSILLTAATDYNIDELNYDRSIDPEEICTDLVNKASIHYYEDLKDRHINEHRAIFNRVRLSLDDDEEYSMLSTDLRLENFKNSSDDAGLVALYFQFGRYLLMNSSRYPGKLPANLQGIWNEHLDAPWNSDFHTNINLQMNYWPAESCNLSETVIPLTDFFSKLMEPGKVTAKEMYGADGWMMHHLTDPFGRTGLMDGVGWGTSPLAGSWMVLSFWRHYQFTLDRDYLREKAYPLMKESAKFILDFLIEDSKGRLVTVPSTSPENAYINPKDGKKYGMTYAATIDIQIINELFNACIVAANELKLDQEFVDKLESILEKLPPVLVGKDGTIVEWIEDYEEAEPGHRHMSHLFGLHPGTQITEKNIQLFNAAKETIEKRLSKGGGHTGWSRAWIVNFYARLLDPENAYKHLKFLLQKSTLPNLFDNHPPFQIDGNFGGTAGIAEMLLQSHGNEIHLLPALPKIWNKGYIEGLKARGNFVVDIYWSKGELSKVIVQSNSGGPCNLRYKDKSFKTLTKIGEKYSLNEELMPL